MNQAIESRNFVMHENLLYDVIMKQAGTLDKAILEGAMNLVEAGATEGKITLLPTRVVIADNGKGFQTRQEIIEAFETFGKSDERKKEDKRWAQFQMGRGQLFAFGKTTYRTRTFEMVVDVKGKGLKYELVEDLEDVPGCVVTVELYSPITEYDVVHIGNDIKRNLKYVRIPISLNNDVITKDPATERWTLETDEAYFRFSESVRGIKVYNLGVYVEEHYAGVGGVVVSKKRLDLNFARNQVIRSCPVWKSIAKNFREKSEKTLLQKRSFTTEDVVMIIARLRDGEYQPWQVEYLKLLKTANNKRVSLRQLYGYDSISFDGANSIKADRIMNQQNRVILDCGFVGEVVRMDGAGEAQVYAALRTLANSVVVRGNGAPYFRNKGAVTDLPPYIPVDEIYAEIDDSIEYLEGSKVPKDQALALAILNNTFNLYFLRETLGESAQPRTIRIARAEKAYSWTDGSTQIGFETDYFGQHIRSMQGWLQIAGDLAENYCYASADRVQGDDFNERFKEAILPFVKLTPVMFREFMKKLTLRLGKTFGNKAMQDLESLNSAAQMNGEDDSTQADDGGSIL